VVEYLRCFILENQTDWDKWITYATFVFNTSPHSSTGYAPHELLFGRKANIPGILQKETPEVRYNYDNYVQELQFDCSHATRLQEQILRLVRKRVRTIMTEI